LTKELDDTHKRRLEQSCSIALCTYNGEKYLEELLGSILSQTVPPDEIIIVDDCSSDGTVSLLKSFAEKCPQIKLHLQSTNLGPISAFQLAISMTSMPFVFLADQDDIWSPRKIELMLSSGTGHRSDLPFLAFSDLEAIDEKGDLVSTSFWKMVGLYPHQTTFKSLLFGNVVTGCASMINAKMKEYLSIIPQGVLMHDHWMALIAYGFGQAEYKDEPLVKYRIHASTVTRKSAASLVWRIRQQFTHLTTAYFHFLNKEVTQAEVFKNKFYDLLSDPRKAEIDQFISLRNKPFAKKKFASYSKFNS